MKFVIELDIDKPSFGRTYESQNTEIARILEDIIDCVKSNAYTLNCKAYERDLNGKCVGYSMFKEL